MINQLPLVCASQTLTLLSIMVNMSTMPLQLSAFALGPAAGGPDTSIAFRFPSSVPLGPSVKWPAGNSDHRAIQVCWGFPHNLFLITVKGVSSGPSQSE